MPALRSTGYFRELEFGEPNAASLRESAQPRAAADEDAIYRYLDSAPALMWSPQLVHDVFKPDEVIGTAGVQTDGVWEWPSELAYYVRQYHVRLEPEFVAHMADRGWQAPAPADVDVDVLAMLGLPPES